MGVLRYSLAHRKAVWQHRRKFQGPASYCRIWQVEDVVVFVKGETEIVGVDMATGEQRWSRYASPYLYSRIKTIGTDLLYGTAGRDGAIELLDGVSGGVRWSRPLKNGCSYYAVHAGSVFVGDFDGCVRRLCLRTGTELDRIELPTEVVGDITVGGDRLYTVAWPDEGHPPRLICIVLT